MKKWLAALVLVPSVAFGMEVPAETEVDPATGRPIVYAKETEVIFDGLRVDGQLYGPEGTLIVTTPRLVFNPLIRLRMDFNEEMQSSVDALK